jgi:hypothetical protein
MTKQQGRLREERGHRVVGPLAQPDLSRHWVATTTAIIMTVVSIAMSIAAAAAQYMQQQAAAEANHKNQVAMMRAQDEAIRQNAALANRDYMNQTKALQDKQAQEDAAAGQRESDVSVQAAQARSTAQTAAGEAGVGGLSVNALMDDFTRQEADYRTQSRTNLEGLRDQTSRELEAAQIQGQGRTESMKPYQPTPIQYPSLVGAALRVGGESAGALSSYYGKQTPQTPTYNTPRAPRGGYGDGGFAE